MSGTYFSFKGKKGGSVTIIEGFGSGVTIRNRPCVLQFAESWNGSLFRLFTRCDPRYDVEMHQDISPQLQECLNSGVIDFSAGAWSMQAQLCASLQAMFTKGNYQADFFRSTGPPLSVRDKPLVEVTSKPGPPKPSFPWGLNLDYPAEHVCPWDLGAFSAHSDDAYVILLTQSDSLLDRSRVEHYRKEIRRGVRPIILAAEIHNQDRVILDGHHKFMAYLTFPQINPAWLLVKLKVPKQTRITLKDEEADSPYTGYLSLTHQPLKIERKFLRYEATQTAYQNCLDDSRLYIKDGDENDKDDGGALEWSYY